MEYTIIHFVLAFIGLLMNNALEIRKSMRRNSETFDIGYFLKDKKNWFDWILSIAVIVTCYMLGEETKEFIGVDIANKMGSFLLGFGAHAAVDKLSSKKKHLENEEENSN